MKTTHLMLMSAFCFSQGHAFTLPKQPIKSYDCDVCSRLSHDTLHDKWAISDQPLNHKVSNAQKSYGYKEQVTLQQLQKGVTLATLAPGAVVRITPLENKTVPQLMIKTPTGQSMRLKNAAKLYSKDEDLGDSLLAKEHQILVQVKPELGFGQFVIKTDGDSSQDADRYMISVLDKFALTYLQVESDAMHYQYGDTLTATITLDCDDYYTIDDVEATLVGPAGQSIPLKITELKNNKFSGSALLNSEFNDHGENWYIEANVISLSGEHIIKRTGHAAFSYSVPSASVLNVKKISSKPLTFVATIDVATASRYALQSVLYQKDLKGQAKPLETSQRAQWLEPGKQVIQFSFDNSNQLADDNLFLGYLRLTDYGQLKVVYQYNHPVKLTQLVG